MGISPGDTLRYTIDESGVKIDKSVPREDADRFVAFAEWDSPEDDEAFAEL